VSLLFEYNRVPMESIPYIRNIIPIGACDHPSAVLALSGWGILMSTARSKGRWVTMLGALVLGLAIGVVLTSPNMHPRPAKAQTDEHRARIIIDGIEVAKFTAVDDVTNSIRLPHDYAEASKDTTGWDGIVRPFSLLLERPADDNLEMHAWYQQASEEHSDYKKAATLILYDGSGNPIMRILLENAWPASSILTSRTPGL
jgi:hypothetical protein